MRCFFILAFVLASSGVSVRDEASDDDWLYLGHSAATSKRHHKFAAGHNKRDHLEHKTHTLKARNAMISSATFTDVVHLQSGEWAKSGNPDDHPPKALEVGAAFILVVFVAGVASMYFLLAPEEGLVDAEDDKKGSSCLAHNKNVKRHICPLMSGSDGTLIRPFFKDIGYDHREDDYSFDERRHAHDGFTVKGMAKCMKSYWSQGISLVELLEHINAEDSVPALAELMKITPMIRRSVTDMFTEQGSKAEFDTFNRVEGEVHMFVGLAADEMWRSSKACLDWISKKNEDYRMNDCSPDLDAQGLAGLPTELKMKAGVNLQRTSVRVVIVLQNVGVDALFHDTNPASASMHF